MNRVYYNEFKGLDGILNRVEILSEVSGIEEYVKTGNLLCIKICRCYEA